MSLRAVIDASAKPCPICNAGADLFGVVDFHKSCIEAKGLKLSMSGIPVYYRRCPECRFVFTDAFDAWSPGDFQRHIYNKDYHLVDPEYAGARAAECAQIVDRLFNAKKSALRMLDYGGGDGKLAEILRQDGYRIETFDPFSKHNIRPAGNADIVTAFEVMEHSHRPGATLDDMISFLGPEGMLLFSTSLQPDDFDEFGLNWWYVAPRNGHVSIYSRAALNLLFQSRGLDVVSINGSFHLACRGIPAFAEDLFNTVKMASTAA